MEAENDSGLNCGSAAVGKQVPEVEQARGPFQWLAGGPAALLAAAYAASVGFVLHHNRKRARPTDHEVNGVQAVSQNGKPVGR